VRPLIAPLFMAFATACVPAMPGALRAGSSPVVYLPAEHMVSEADCRAKGGVWEPICRRQQDACVIGFPDAGSPCTDSSQCRGGCYADLSAAVLPGEPAAGLCAANSNPCGCKALVESGRAGPMLCVD